MLPCLRNALCLRNAVRGRNTSFLTLSACFFFAFYFILFSVYERVYLSRIIKAERILIQYASRATIKCLRALWARESAFVIYFSLCFGMGKC